MLKVVKDQLKSKWVKVKNNLFLLLHHLQAAVKQ